MRGERGFVQVALRARLVVEIAVLVLAAHQRGRIAHLGLAHVSRDVADRQADAAVVGSVRLRAVHHLDVMQRHLARLEDAIHRLSLVDLHRDLLAARKQVVLVEGIDMRELLAFGEPGMKCMQPLSRLAGERHPRGHHVVLLEAPIGRILVPGDEAGAVRLLDEEVRGPAQEIGPEHVLDRVEDLGMVDQLVAPGEQQVRLVPPIALQRLAGLRSCASRHSR